MYTQVSVSAVSVPNMWRKPHKATVKAIADSFEEDGQLQPIGVRPDPDSPDEYVLVYGKRRLEAAKKLGWGSIEAKVITCDGDAAGAMTNAENLFRSPLTAAEKVIALKDWNERYRAKHPELLGRGKAGGEAKRRAKQGLPPTDVKPFAVHVEEVTGLERSRVHAYLKAGKNLTDEQLGVLAEAKASRDQVRQINDLTEDRRTEAVTPVASGLAVADAIVQATLPPNATVEKVGGSADDPVREDYLTDEDWLALYCDEVLARLKFKESYVRAAMLYRRTREARHAFAKEVRPPMRDGKSPKADPLYRMLARLVNVEHPKHWLPCGPCGGSGQVSGDKCSNCWGHGFALKTGVSSEGQRHLLLHRRVVLPGDHDGRLRVRVHYEAGRRPVARHPLLPHR
jgi:ParB-like chromosome segregation protein Spo0J